MSETNIAILKALRERTGAGVVACRNALAEAGGDTERAADILRERETHVAQAKVQRIAAQGVIGVWIADSRAVLLEVNCESDFVARSSEFVSGVSECLRIAVEHDTDDDLLGNRQIDAVLTSLSARTGERVLLRRARVVPITSEQIVSTYVHGGDGRNVGRIGVVVALDLPQSNEANELTHGLAMHIAASAPQWISADDIPADVLEGKRAEFSAEAMRAGKPPAIVPRIVEGRVEKYVAQSTLLGQPYALNPDDRVGDVLGRVGESAGRAVVVRHFLRFQVGETELDSA